MVERKNGDWVGIWLGIGGCKRLCRRGRGHGLVTMLSLFVSVKDRSLHKASWASHRLIIPSTYLGMGAWKTYCSLVMDEALSGLTVRMVFGYWRSLHRTKSRTQERGLGVLVWTGT